MLYAPIIIEEITGLDRINEPITLGIPFPRGMPINVSQLTLIDPQGQGSYLPLQTQVLAKWPDQSLKWVLLDFQVSVKAKTSKELRLQWKGPNRKGSVYGYEISIDRVRDSLKIDTKTASFFINTIIFKPFDRVLMNGKDLLSGTPAKFVLTDETGTEFEPVISNIFHEVRGKLRTTLKAEGEFKSSNGLILAAFFSRISFFAHSSLVKIDFTLLNPKASKHPDGLWDLGDPGSLFFRDLSLHVSMNSPSGPITVWKTQPNSPKKQAKVRNLVIYQDSSGGENWKSLNHINRNGEVRNSFRGYRVYSDGKIIQENVRANPVISLSAKDMQISGAVRHFWQNFPKALEVNNDSILTIRLFPHQYDDLFELQGGEQKTHTIFLHFVPSAESGSGLEWIHDPLLPRSTPEWYAHSKAFCYMLPESEDPNKDYVTHISTAIRGDNTFFDRREVIDEYGWRHFGDIYADHEAIGYEGPKPLISHYNNQYDGGIYGALVHYVRSGDSRWFTLADNLSNHIRDIDIYHTDSDKPGYNRGLFWHTEHYIDAATGTHRCFSKKHLRFRNAANYGGGPSLSHVYTTGFLHHYYLTGDTASRDAVKELASFVISNIDMEGTICFYLVGLVKRVKGFIKKYTQNGFHKKDEGPPLPYNVVYGVNGPGRASGNALNVLIDAYLLTEDPKYLHKAEELILQCIHPADDIKKRDLLDIENRWMYTIFLQALGKYLDLKREMNQIGDIYCYARGSLIHYARWMLENEYPYLETPDRLEYPNETWAAQELRKSNVFKYAARYSKDRALSLAFVEKSRSFFNASMEQLAHFPTRYLARPLILLMVNGYMQSYFDLYSQPCEKDSTERALHSRLKKITVWKKVRNSSVKQEIRWLMKLLRSHPLPFPESKKKGFKKL